MKSVWFLLIILSSFTVSCTPASSDKLPVEATLKELDETLSHKADYEQNKEQHLQSIKKLAANANTPENLYMILDKLYSD